MFLFMISAPDSDGSLLEGADPGTMFTSRHLRLLRHAILRLTVFVESAYVFPKHLKIQKRDEGLEWWFGDSIPLSSL